MIPSQTSQVCTHTLNLHFNCLMFKSLLLKPPQTDAISANHLVPSNASMNLDRESTSNDNDTDDEEMEIDRDLTRRTVTRGRRAMPNRGRRARGGRGARRGGGALFRGQGRTLVDDNEGMAAERVDNSTLAVNNQSAEGLSPYWKAPSLPLQIVYLFSWRRSWDDQTTEIAVAWQ